MAEKSSKSDVIETENSEPSPNPKPRKTSRRGRIINNDESILGGPSSSIPLTPETIKFLRANDTRIPPTVDLTRSEREGQAGSSSDGRRQGTASDATTTGKGSRSREWVCTIPEASFSSRDELEEALNSSSSAVYQLEEGAGGFRHYQLWVRYANQVALSTIAKRFNNSHCEPCKNTEASKRYCSKEESRIDGPFYRGNQDQKQPGKRNDILELESAVKRGSTDRDLWQEHFGTMLRYHKAIGRARASLGVGHPPRKSCTIWVFWGTSGTGKSARAHQMAPDAYCLSSAPTENQGLWWDGYAGQRDVILDEFTNWIKITTLLTWLDIYPVTVQIKGDSLPLLAERWFLTSNQDPTEWYPNAPQSQRDAVQNRLFNGRGGEGRGFVVHVTSTIQSIDGVPRLNFLDQTNT